MTEAFRAITNAQPVSIDMTGAELRYETAANGSAVAVARFQGGRTVMGFGGNAESIAKNGTVRGVAILSRGALKIVGRAVSEVGQPLELVDENGEAMEVPECDDRKVVFHRPIPFVLVDDTGHAEEHVFASIDEMIESLGLDAVDGIAHRIVARHAAGDVYVAIQPCEEGILDARTLLISDSAEDLLQTLANEREDLDIAKSIANDQMDGDRIMDLAENIDTILTLGSEPSAAMLALAKVVFAAREELVAQG